MKKNELWLNFSNNTHNEMFEAFIYSVNGQQWDDVKLVSAGSWKLTFHSAQAAYSFGYAWAAHQWTIDKAKYTLPVS